MLRTFELEELEIKKEDPWTEFLTSCAFAIHGTLRKLSAPRRGPYTVTRVYTNGTLRIKRGAISERVNIRHIWLFNEQDTSE